MNKKQKKKERAQSYPAKPGAHKDAPPSAPRVLVCDIETAPITAHCWGVRDQFIGLDQVIEDWSVIAFAAKWYGAPKITYRDTGGRGPSKVRNDKALLTELAALLDSADIVVGHNAKAFDLKKISARMIQHGMPPHSPVRVIDTYHAAKKAGAFSSNKLAYLSEKLGADAKDSHAKFPGMSLWVECLKDNPAAWAAMKSYNKKDVLVTEELYTTLRPYITGHPNMTLFSESADEACGKCGSTNLQARGVSVTQTGRFKRLCCQACGSWSRSKQNLVPLDTRKKILADA